MPALGEGVSVKQVLALTPHVTLSKAPDSPAPAPPGEDVWGSSKVDARPTTEDVESFITDVTNGVGMRLLRLAYLTNPTVAETLRASANSVIVVGAAATLISAVYPTKAGLNDQSSYSAELWARYNIELDKTQAALEQALKDQFNPNTGGTASQIRGTFRDATITDDLVW